MTDPNSSDGLRRLIRLNRTGAFLAALVVGLAGFFVPGIWGALVLLAVAATLAVLLRSTWAVTPPPLRMARLVILVGLVAVATVKII